MDNFRMPTETELLRMELENTKKILRTEQEVNNKILDGMTSLLKEEEEKNRRITDSLTSTYRELKKTKKRAEIAERKNAKYEKMLPAVHRMHEYRYHIKKLREALKGCMELVDGERHIFTLGFLNEILNNTEDWEPELEGKMQPGTAEFNLKAMRNISAIVLNHSMGVVSLDMKYHYTEIMNMDSIFPEQEMTGATLTVELRRTLS